jgi:hypothetical protein
MSTDNEGKGFDTFELLGAILLGLGAIGAALAAFQGGLWDGKMIEYYGEASTISTKASTAYNEATVISANDSAVSIQAKRLTLEGLNAGDSAARDLSFELAGYLYAFQMSDEAYKNLGFPEGVDSPEMAKQAEQQGSVDILPDELLVAALEKELDEKYVEAICAEGAKLFEDADKKFEEGRKANDIGDKFDLSTVLYAISLFFAGIAMVFKTNIKWVFYFIGVAAFLGSTIYMVMQPWA